MSRQYDLNPNYRYINRGGYIYVVDPKTYAVQRIIAALDPLAGHVRLEEGPSATAGGLFLRLFGDNGSFM